jgi:Tfp pilus assembly protein PilF
MIIVLIVAVVGIAFVYNYEPNVSTEVKAENENAVTIDQETEDQNSVIQLLNQDKSNEALEIVRKYDTKVNNQSEAGKKWLDLLIKISEKLNHAEQLVVLYEYFPDAFDKREEAATMIAKNYLVTGKNNEFDQLRLKWKGQEIALGEWLLLDVDRLIVEKRNQEALDLLKAHSFTGKNERDRLIRLGFLTIDKNPQQTWNYFTGALELDSDNPILHLYRAQLLEAAGKNSLALSEYIAAAQLKPENIVLRDQVAEYFLRHYRYRDALEAWNESLNLPLADSLWLKTWFWSRVALPLEKNPFPQEASIPYLNYLIGLKPNQFWNDAEFDKLPDHQTILTTEQSSFWLNLIQNLKENREEKALKLIQANHFKNNSWFPDLEKALERILTYRKTGALAISARSEIEITLQKQEEKNKDSNTTYLAFFEELETLSHQLQNDSTHEIPQKVRDLLLSNEAFSAAFLAAGWMEAALDLHQMDVISSRIPEWVTLKFTQAMKETRGISEALAFAKKQSETADLQLLIGELLYNNNEFDDSLAFLQPLASQKNAVGNRATWLISLVYIEKQDYAKARETLKKHPRLSREVLGQETLARIALLEGNMKEADDLYTTIETKSSEAKSYLARKAFAEKNWARAKELTQQLLLEHPTSQLIRQNMMKIIESETHISLGS